MRAARNTDGGLFKHNRTCTPSKYASSQTGKQLVPFPRRFAFHFVFCFSSNSFFFWGGVFFYRYIPGFVPPRSIRSARGVHRFMNSSATRGRRCFFTGRDTAGENNVWPRRCHGGEGKISENVWGIYENVRASGYDRFEQYKSLNVAV